MNDGQIYIHVDYSGAKGLQEVVGLATHWYVNLGVTSAGERSHSSATKILSTISEQK